MKIRRSHRRIKALGLALAVAAFAAPSAQALVVAGEDGNVGSSQSAIYSDNYPTPPLSIQPIYTDNFRAAVPRSQVSALPILYTDHPRSPVSTGPVAPLVRSELVSNSSTFDWGDAVIGAGITFVLMGLGAAILAARLTRRSRLAAV